MAILAANIGTSDISVKIGDYYIPISFNKEEPNLVVKGLNDSERDVWEQLKTLVGKFSQEKFGLNSSRLDFRAFTQQLLLAYTQNPDEWHSQIRIGRIWGTIQSAIQTAQEAELPLESIFLFVTDQEPQHHQDTIHASEIILKWLSMEAPELFAGDQPQIKLTQQLINPKVAANDEDSLIEEYYNFFQTFDRSKVAYISIRGGTPQMQSALRTQAISANFKAQIILQPTLNVAEIINGNASGCKPVAYWRYQQTQRYAAVRQLLDRWDFDGAVVLLRSWRETLQSLIDNQVTDDKHELQDKRDAIEQVLASLNIAIACLNLDRKSAKRLLDKTFGEVTVPFKPTIANYNLLHNLYTQCRIYHRFQQVPNFIARMGSFYEASQNYLIKELQGNKYLHISKTEKRSLLIDELSRHNPQLWEKFLEIHRCYIKSRRWTDERFQPGYQWDSNRLELKDRFTKNSFLKALAEQQDKSCSDKHPNFDLWLKLDFWYDQRNDIIHGSAGISGNRLRLLHLESSDACNYEEILKVMQAIMGEVGVNTSANDYYIYSEIREWALNRLK